MARAGAVGAVVFRWTSIERKNGREILAWAAVCWIEVCVSGRCVPKGRT